MTVLINPLCRKTLGLDYRTADTRMSCVETVIERRRKLTSFEVSNLEESFSVNMEDVWVGQITSGESDAPPSNEEISDFDHMHDVWFPEVVSDKIGLVVSVEYAYTWLGKPISRSTADKPLAVETDWG